MNFKEYRETEGRKYLPMLIAAFVVFSLCVSCSFCNFRFSVSYRIYNDCEDLMPFFMVPFCLSYCSHVKYFNRNFKKRLRPHMKKSQRADLLSNVLSVALSILLVLAAVFALATLTMQSVIDKLL